MSKRNAKRVLSMIAAIVMMVCFTGCNLAVPEAGVETNNPDRLIGVFITVEALEKEMLPATLDTKESTDPSNWQLLVEGAEGIVFCDMLFELEGQEPYTMIMRNDVICNMATHINVSENGEERTLKGTLYLASKIGVGEYHIFTNPMYQKADGTVYVKPGDANGIGEDTGYTSMTLTLSDSYENLSNKVELSIERMESPKTVKVVCMDEDNQVVEEKEYVPGTLPEQLAVKEGTAYIVVETLDEEGGSERTLYDITEEENPYIESFYMMDEYKIKKQHTEILLP